MANTSLLQVRTSAEDKEKASAILEKLGTNLSAVVNMLIKQIIITEGILFEVKMSHPIYSVEEAVNEVRATMAFEYINLTEEDDFAVRLAYYFSEINALHPFREGNGRSQREFIRCLAPYNGYVINFVNAGKDEMLEASRESFLCEYGAMERLFRKCLRK